MIKIRLIHNLMCWVIFDETNFQILQLISKNFKMVQTNALVYQFLPMVFSYCSINFAWLSSIFLQFWHLKDSILHRLQIKKIISY